MSPVPRHVVRAQQEMMRRQSRGLHRMAGGSIDGSSEQAAPMPQRPKTEPYRPIPSAVGSRFATLVVASSESSDDGKETADYVCTGTDDQDTIQQAMLRLDDEFGAGEVVFLEGRYFQSAPWAPVSSETYLRGMGRADATSQFVTVNGWDSTDFLIDCNLSNDDFIGRVPAGVSNLGFDCSSYDGGGIQWGASNAHVAVDMTIENCLFDGCTQALKGAYPSGQFLDYYISLLGNRFNGCGTNSLPALEFLRRVFQFVMIGNTFDSAFAADYDLWMENGTTYLTDQSPFACIGLNTFYNQLHLDGFYGLQYQGNVSDGLDLLNSDFGTVTGNTFETDSTFDVVEDFTVNDNVFIGTASFTDCERDVVSGNHLGEAGPDALYFSACADCTVAGNNLTLTSGTPGSSNAAITVTLSSSGMHVHGNTMRPDAGGGPYVDYGVKVATACNNNKVFNNDGMGVWATAAVLDAGTGTDLTGANR